MRLVINRAIVGVLLGFIAALNCSWIHGVGITAGWHTLPIGGGGALPGLILVCNLGAGQCSPGVGTTSKMLRTDVGGAAYWFNPSTGRCGSNVSKAGPCWQNILTPVNFAGSGIAGYNVDSSARDFTISPSNPSIVTLYNGQDGCLYQSTTGPGGIYAKVSAFTCTGFFNTNGSAGGQHYILSDPNNANVIYVSAPANQGAFVTVNGGTSWTNTSSLFPTSGSASGLSAVYAFDTSNGTSGTCPGSSCRTQNIFSCVNGTGVYKSVNSGVAFTELNTSGMPTTCFKIDADPSGALWVNDQNHIYKWTPSAVGSTSGTWTTQVSPGTANSADFAIDRNASCASGCRVVALQYNGDIDETDNGGTSWSGFNSNFSIAATDAPWLSNNGANSFLNTESVEFDPTQSNVLDVSAGAAFFTTSPPGNSTSAFTYTSQTLDIEEIVANRIINPPGFTPVLGGWDRGTWSLQSQFNYPSFYAPNISIVSNRAWDVTYCNDFSSTGQIIQIGPNGNGYITSSIGNGNPSNWTQLASIPLEATVPGVFGGGTILCLSQNNYIWKVGEGGDVYATTNGGTSWSKLAPTGVPIATAGITSGATTTSQNTLTFSGSPVYIDPAFIASVSAGNVTTAVDASNNFCTIGTVSSVTPPTSTTVTLTANAGCPVSIGDAIRFLPNQSGTMTGWGTNAIGQNGIVDAQSTNVAYIYNDSATAPGIWKFYISGGTFHSVLASSGSIGVAGATGTLVGVPTTAGDMYFTNSIPSGSPPNSGSLFECVDSNPAGTGAGTVTCQAVTTANGYGANVSSVWAIGTGAAKVGGSGYAGIEFYGSTDGINMGVWRTFDHFQTFTQVAGSQFQGCGNSGACASSNGDMFEGRFDQITTMSGSLITPGLFDICFGGTACIYGYFN